MHPTPPCILSSPKFQCLTCCFFALTSPWMFWTVRAVSLVRRWKVACEPLEPWKNIRRVLSKGTDCRENTGRSLAPRRPSSGRPPPSPLDKRQSLSQPQLWPVLVGPSCLREKNHSRKHHILDSQIPDSRAKDAILLFRASDTIRCASVSAASNF